MSISAGRSSSIIYLLFIFQPFFFNFFFSIFFIPFTSSILLFFSFMQANPERLATYDMYVCHESLRVSMLLSLEGRKSSPIPKPFLGVMQQKFVQHYDNYIKMCLDNEKHDAETVVSVLSFFFIKQKNQTKYK